MKPLLISLAAVLLAACANRPVTDRSTVEILPKSIAKDIVAKNLGADWAASPYIIKSGACVDRDIKVPIDYRDIKGITHNPTLGKLFIFKENIAITQRFLFFPQGCFEQITFPMTPAAATEVSTALRSLGACTSSQSFAC